MPKDWDHHKAEIERLYMVERRPLKDVRNILKTQFAFDASIRAYRMKLDEWQLWKNNSKNVRRTTKTRSRRRQQPPAIEVSDSEEHVPPAAMTMTLSSSPEDSPPLLADFVQIGGVPISNRPLDFPDLLPWISPLYDESPLDGLQTILLKWKSDGSYLKGALKYLHDHRSHIIYFRARIFNLITGLVAFHEKFPLAKRCLEIDFKKSQEPNSELPDWCPKWAKIWRAACALPDWEKITKCMRMIELEPTGPGVFFSSTALPVLAEKLLQTNMETIESWTSQAGSVSAFGIGQVNTCLQESIIILSSLKNDTFDVDKIWYKRFLQFNQSHIAQTGNASQLEWYRKRFLRLRTLHESIDQSLDPIQNLLSVANVLKESRVILDAAPSEDVPLAKSALPSRQSTPTAIQLETSSSVGRALRTLIEDVYKRWSWGTETRDDVNGLLKKLEMWMSNSLSPEENVFILISRIIPPRDQVCFAAAILAEIDRNLAEINENIFALDGEWNWASWLTIYGSSSLQELKMHLNLPIVLEFYLDDGIGLNAVVLILDAFVAFAGKLVLPALQGKIRRRHSDGKVYHKYGRDYMMILNKFHTRGLKVDQNWYEFLGEMLSWEAIDPALLQPSEEESDESCYDSTESEDETVDEPASEDIS
ncbi:hypothetical protein N431DRAFT_487364 [Stipitochalara longipes BDJ]|nr:hypothetical protein N431DRAFT_487364 [Stipitochalara longipes BDJ]